MGLYCIKVNQLEKILILYTQEYPQRLNVKHLLLKNDEIVRSIMKVIAVNLTG